MELTYIGGHDAVEVHVPDWPVEPTVANGESYEFPAEIAERLLEQPTNWERTPKKKQKAAPANDDAGATGEEQK